jgi:deoxycytidine triphosphate deaminase
VNKSFEEIVPESGFLVDSQIHDALTQGYLIEKGTWDESQIRHASYQLRLGDRVEIARARNSTRESTKELSIVKLSNINDTLELRPGDTALLYSGENIKLPNSVLGFTVARGLLFVESLVPENTYIDPGFAGTLYTTVTNVSGRVIQLKYQTPIARVFFFKLSRPVTSSYSTGAAMGISQELASVPASSIPTQEDARYAKIHVLLEEIGRIPIGGVHLAESISRCRSKEDWILVFSFVWPIILLFFNTSGWVRDMVKSAFVVNVLAGLTTAPLVYLGALGLRKLREQ